MSFYFFIPGVNTNTADVDGWHERAGCKRDKPDRAIRTPAVGNALPKEWMRPPPVGPARNRG